MHDDTSRLIENIRSYMLVNMLVGVKESNEEESYIHEDIN
jgi:hypothetical protein